ncbi:GntR family transcriptional regulator [Bradyrhizobium sp. PRIMUS42]|uniref:GntR family transcriptional regulator n=1 Tax=Bradyrhizobium sp. PRIMUS42 TaxID=2908926 RepID=UPI001FF53855|nr:GntR family transcriptional regulator [Bradyrhizobium sp. PRIMUS42]MCJ9728665.1 GntR family transcriptional regulator [Bradyrhizobium sp. PRIMUS42]
MDTLELQVERRAATLRLQVEERLRAAIASGRFKPGQRLVERELCELTGVGRTSIREALRQLEAEGLITSVPHRGPVVSTISREEAAQLYDLRAVLEGFAGRAFAMRRRAEDLRAMAEAVTAFAKSAKAGKQDELIRTKSEFYAVLLRGCGNMFVEQTLTMLHNRISLLRFTSMTQAGRLKHSVAEIRAIAEAVSAGDADKAELLCRRHIEEAAKVALKVLDTVKPPAADYQYVEK